MSHLLTTAIVYVLPGLTVNVRAITVMGRAFARRRGYEFLTVSRDWSEAQWFLDTRRAQTVILASPSWAEMFGANTIRIDRRIDNGGQQAAVTAVGCCPVIAARPDATVVELPTRACAGRHRAPSDSLVGRVVRHPAVGMSSRRIRAILAGAEAAPESFDPATVAALRRIARHLRRRS